jgi:hypothetical protein
MCENPVFIAPLLNIQRIPHHRERSSRASEKQLARRSVADRAIVGSFNGRWRNRLGLDSMTKKHFEHTSK